MAKYHFYLEGQKKAFREKDDSQKVILNAEILNAEITEIQEWMIFSLKSSGSLDTDSVN